MKLAKYLSEKGISQDEFAKMAGVSQGVVSQWAGGRSKPSLKRIVKIERLTQGQVTRKDWHPDFPWDPPNTTKATTTTTKSRSA